MPAPVASWNLVPVTGTWRGHDGALKVGTYKVTYPRVTNVTNDAIIPAGIFAQGDLNTTGNRSLDLMLPATDDTDNVEQDFAVTIEVTFTNAAKETYSVHLPVGGSLNLRTVIPSFSSIPMQQPQYKMGVAGGLAMLDPTGKVLDGNGNPVTGGGSGASTVAGITDAGATGRSILQAATPLEARAAIGAGTSNLALGSTPSTAKAGDWVPAWADVTGKPATYAPTIGTTAATAKAGNWVPGWAEVTGKPATFPPTIGTTAADAKAGNWVPAWAEVTGKPTTYAPTIGTTAATAKAGDWVPAWAEVTGKPATFTPAAHQHSAADVTSGTLPVDRAPAGSIIASTSATARPTARADVTVLFKTTADPSAVMLEGDLWARQA